MLSFEFFFLHRPLTLSGVGDSLSLPSSPGSTRRTNVVILFSVRCLEFGITLSSPLEVRPFSCTAIDPEPSSRHPGSGGGVDPALRLAQKKRYRDLHGEPQTYALSGTNQPLDSPFLKRDQCSTASPPVSPVPPLSSTPIRAPTTVAAVHRSMLEWGDISATAVLAHAQRDLADHVQQVVSPLITPASRYLVRSDEARDLDALPESRVTESRHGRSELANSRGTCTMQASALERMAADWDWYRTERDALRGLHVTPSSAPRPAIRDPYENPGCQSPVADDAAVPDGAAPRWTRHREVAMPPLEILVSGLSRHPSYHAPILYGPGPPAPPHGPSR